MNWKTKSTDDIAELKVASEIEEKNNIVVVRDWGWKPVSAFRGKKTKIKKKIKVMKL